MSIEIRCTEADVRNVPEPEWTDTWHPISHARCIDTIENALSNKGLFLKLQKTEYSLSKDGKQCYSTLVLGNGSKELSQTLIWRNALNKYFSFGICGGTHAWACSNLQMFGEFVEFRKHTSGMDDTELLRVVSKGIDVIYPKIAAYRVWHLALHNIKFTSENAKALAYEAFQEGIISRSKFTEFHNLLFGEQAKYNPHELYGFHGTCTQLMRDMRMSGGFVERQQKLMTFINQRFSTRLPEVV